MTTRKRNIEIEILVDDKRARQNLQNIDKSTAHTAKGFGQLSGAVKLAAGAFVATHAVDFVKDLVTASSDLNESVNAVNVTFGESADGVLKLGENAAKSVGLANSEFNALAVGFSAFAEKIAGAEGTDVATILDTLTVRMADFASVMNLDVAEAAEKFRSGLAGETEPLRQFGIDVSAAAVTAKALELGLADVASELTEGDKILARYRLIMEQTEKTAGDFENTSGDLANQQRILNAEWENAKAKLGDGLVPVMNELLKALNPLIAGVGTLAAKWGEFQKALDETIESGNPFESFSAGLNKILTTGALPALIALIERAGDVWNDLFGAGEVTLPTIPTAHPRGGRPSGVQTNIYATNLSTTAVRELTELARRGVS